MAALIYYLAYGTSASNVSMIMSLTACFLMVYRHAVAICEYTSGYIPPVSHSLLCTCTIDTSPQSNDLRCFSVVVKYFHPLAVRLDHDAFIGKRIYTKALVITGKLTHHEIYLRFFSFCYRKHWIQESSFRMDLATQDDSQSTTNKCKQ